MPRNKFPKEQQKVESTYNQSVAPAMSGRSPDKNVGGINKTSNQMSKRFVAVVVVIVIVLVFAGVWVGSILTGAKSGTASGYTAVFLTSGDVYFGKLSWFPWPKLSKAWFLQRSTDEKNQPQIGLAPFSSVFWGPEGDVYLNPKQILFWAPIKSDSNVAKAIENPDSVRQQAPQGQAPQQQGQLPPPPQAQEKPSTKK